MSLVEFVGLITVPVNVIAAPTLVFLAVAMASEKYRLETLKVLHSKDLGSKYFSKIATWWAQYFHRLFGKKSFAKRQLLTVPAYTLIVSGVFFAVWICYLYIFRNSGSTFTGDLPATFKQAVSDFYRKGIVGALIIDFCTIQGTKFSIEVGRRKGYYSLSFAAAFIGTFLAAYFLFSVAVLLFRIDDMVTLYSSLVPNDPMPVIPYSPIENLGSSLRLFQPETIIYVTSKGWISTYLMPEPLIFYCVVTAQLSLVFITVSFQVASALDAFKRFCIRLVRKVGTAQAGANSVLIFVFITMVTIPLLFLSFLALAAK